MKYCPIATAVHKLKSLASFLQRFLVTSVVPQQSLPAFPDIEWELSGETGYRDRIRVMARFFFVLGCMILGTAICVYLWQSMMTF